MRDRVENLLSKLYARSTPTLKVHWRVDYDTFTDLVKGWDNLVQFQAPGPHTMIGHPIETVMTRSRHDFDNVLNFADERPDTAIASVRRMPFLLCIAFTNEHGFANYLFDEQSDERFRNHERY